MKDFSFKIAGRNYNTKVEEQENGTLLVTVNDKTYEVEMPEQGHASSKPVVKPAAAAASAPAAAPKAAAAPAAEGSTIAAPLPGTITKIVAKAGQQVKKGDVIIVMEAMKMANDIVAEADGTVTAVCVGEGQSVNQGDALVEFQPAAGGAAAPAAPAPKAAPAPAAAPAAAAAASVISAPLPGTITKILVEVGQAVKAGDTVLTMEAMKMENNITAESAGTVKAILVQQGAQVQSGDAMIEIG